MLDLVAQVARHEVHERAALDVGATEHLTQVPLSLRFLVDVFLGELLGTVREVTAEDDRVGPHVPQGVGGEVGRQRALPRRAGDGRVDDVVAQDLLADLLADLAELALGLFLVGAALGHLAELEVLCGDAVLEEQREQRVVDQIAGVEGLPSLIAGDAQESVSDVVVHSEDVGVLVMQVVVGLLPVRRRAGDVPLPRGGVDLRVVHPVPLTVHHVVPEFHVLDDLRERQQANSGEPRRTTTAGEKHCAAADFERTLQTNDVAHVSRILLAARLLDVATNRVEFAAERFDVGVREMCVFLDICNRHGKPPSSELGAK